MEYEGLNIIATVLQINTAILRLFLKPHPNKGIFVHYTEFSANFLFTKPRLKTTYGIKN